jgi:hypothetical protein
VKLHRAACRTIRYRPPFIGSSYIKICATVTPPRRKKLTSGFFSAEAHTPSVPGLPVLALRARQLVPVACPIGRA